MWRITIAANDAGEYSIQTRCEARCSNCICSQYHSEIDTSEPCGRNGVRKKMKRVIDANPGAVLLGCVSKRAITLVKHLACIGVMGLAMAPVALRASEPGGGEVLDVRTAAAIALSTNPGLEEMQARYEAMAEMPEQMGSLPDPMISFGAMNLPTNTFALFMRIFSPMV